MVLVIFESKESEKTMTIQTTMLKKPLSLDKGRGYGKSSISLGALDLLGFFADFPPTTTSPAHLMAQCRASLNAQPECASLSAGLPSE